MWVPLKNGASVNVSDGSNYKVACAGHEEKADYATTGECKKTCAVKSVEGLDLSGQVVEGTELKCEDSKTYKDGGQSVVASKMRVICGDPRGEFEVPNGKCED